jgi:hypothetical protein
MSKESTSSEIHYSAIESYLEKNNNYFTSSSNSEKPAKAVICHLPPDTPAEDISSGLEDLGFNVINMRQMTTRTASNPTWHPSLYSLLPQQET